MARFVVLEDAAPNAVAAAVAELTADGAAVLHTWHAVAGEPAVCVGRITSAADAGQAVLAALAGARLVIETDAPREVVDHLCDDLRRLGEVDHRLRPDVPAVLSGEERALLAQLLAGASLGEAARALHLSRRTADRRLASARATLGARNTAEALRLAVAAGVRAAR